MIFELINTYIFCIKDHGIFQEGEKDTMDPQYRLYKRSLALDLNRHAAVVLEGKSVGKASSISHY